MTRRRLALFALLAMVGGCTRTTGPVEIPAEDLPFAVTRTRGPVDAPTTSQSYKVYFVENDALVELPRDLEAEGASEATVLKALLEGPREAERAREVSTEIPAGVRLLGVRVADGVARVDLSGEFQAPAPPERIALRVAQVVWTLTALSGVRAVSFAIDGEPVAVTTDDGAAVERRVAREDYAKFAPP